MTTTDGSAGLGRSDLERRAEIFHVPNGTIIPARGHFLGTNTTGYSLKDYRRRLTAALATPPGPRMFRTTPHLPCSARTTRRTSMRRIASIQSARTLKRTRSTEKAQVTRRWLRRISRRISNTPSSVRYACSRPVARRRDGRAIRKTMRRTLSSLTRSERPRQPGNVWAAQARRTSRRQSSATQAVNLLFLDATVSDASAPNRDRNTTSDSANASSVRHNDDSPAGCKSNRRHRYPA